MKKFFKKLKNKSHTLADTVPSKLLKPYAKSSYNIEYVVKEKELGKLHKACWYGDLAKVQSLAKKDPNYADKYRRYVFMPFSFISYTVTHHYHQKRVNSDVSIKHHFFMSMHLYVSI